ncbi:MAG: alpha/beta hydrolase-fold protein, partial [Pseudomonadota bacterium]
MKSIIATSLILFSSLVGAQESTSVDAFQGLVDIRKHSIDSEAVGERYEFMVALPASYAESPDTQYPTIYVTDGSALLSMLVGYYRYLYFAEEVPEVIFVALSYSDADWTTGNNRSHDYSAPSAEREDYGGAKDFQAMLRDEVMPLVENLYRSRADRRIVFGQSMGGQFVMYTAHTRPNLFWGHIASNPAMHRNVEFYLPDAISV